MTEKKNWELVNFCENDKYAAKAYCAVHGVDESKNLGDITKVDEKSLDDFTMICGGSPCFPAGTLISMANGEKKPIEDVKVGEFVVTHNGRHRRVSKSGQTGYKHLFGVIADDMCVYTTWNHMFFVGRSNCNEWVEFCDLRLGDSLWVLCDEDDAFITKQITAIKCASKEAVPVYDLTVEEDHSFIANGFAVHNCQDFSVAGKMSGSCWTCQDCGEEYNPLTVHFDRRDACPNCGSKNIDKTRSSLLVEWLRVIREKRPSWGIYENVKNIAGRKFRATFDMFLGELEEYGYNCHWKILNAKDYGVPQNRERLYLIIIKRELDNGKFVFPKPFESDVCMRDALEDEVDERFYVNSPGAQKLIEDLIAEGKLPEDGDDDDCDLRGLSNVNKPSRTVRGGGHCTFTNKHTWDVILDKYRGSDS